MDNSKKTFIRNIFATITVLILCFAISLVIHTVFDTKSLVAPLFVLACFVIAMLTNGYFFGISAALVSVLAVNYAFTFPYFSFNFTIFENLLSAIILIFVTVSTSALTTKIKHQEEVRRQAEREKMRADLLRAVSHDLRTPLTAIYGSASTISENYDVLSDEKKLEIITGIQKDSKWLIRMVENLLSVTRIDSGNVELVKNPVVLEELVDSVLAKFNKNYANVVVHLSIPEEFIIVLADAMLIEQVILNLLENAVQHAYGMTELKLSVYIKDKLAYFEVSDNGCGVSRDKLADIFSGNCKSDDKLTNSQKRCMGIGLSVCRAIINAHKSDIVAENRKNGGMVFRFWLETEEVE